MDPERSHSSDWKPLWAHGWIWMMNTLTDRVPPPLLKQDSREYFRLFINCIKSVTVYIRDVKIHRFASVHRHKRSRCECTGWKSAHRLQFGLNSQCIDCSVFASVKKRFIHRISFHPVSTQQRRSLLRTTEAESLSSTHMEVEEKEKHSAQKNTYKSNVWQHFGFYKKDGQLHKSQANCKRCRAALKSTSSTRNLATHIKRQHGVCGWKEKPES